MRGIHRSPVNSPHKGQWGGALMFSLICVWINGWVNNREAGDLRRDYAHYDVTVMWFAGLRETPGPWLSITRRGPGIVIPISMIRRLYGCLIWIMGITADNTCLYWRGSLVFDRCHNYHKICFSFRVNVCRCKRIKSLFIYLSPRILADWTKSYNYVLNI